MPTEVETMRELARAYWAGNRIECPKHAGALLTGSFVQTTFVDHIFLTCSRGKETFTIPQRPRQMEFYDQQVEGMVENLQRADAILCYRCQSKIEVSAKENGESGVTDYTFTCVRCFSFGRWAGRPELAKIGKD
ncbi:MAG TPA: hypothetical protein VEK11_22715 [Thermoanaerobaculia bacterium]|nr:hypothetical protein [Thermoanaerobaculia bacterium]